MSDVLELEQVSEQTAVVKFNITDAEIAKMKSEYLPLTINGLEDKEGFKKVYEARQDVKRTRVALQKHAKQLKEDAIEWQRKVNAEEKRVVGELSEIEDHLKAEEDKIEAEKERIRKEAEEREAKRIQDRIDALAQYGFGIDYTTIKSIDDATFDQVLENAKAEHAKEVARQQQEEEERRKEQERLKAEREELERLREESAKAQAIIDAENARIAREQKEKEDAIKAEQLKIEEEKAAAEREKQRLADEKRRQEEQQKEIEKAKENARLQAIEDARKERERQEQEIIEAQKAAARDAALRPDKEKLESFAIKLGSLIDFTVQDDKAKLIINDITIMIGKMQKHILQKVKEL